jgi:hypothetical protein
MSSAQVIWRLGLDDMFPALTLLFSFRIHGGIDCSGRKLGSVGLEAVHECFQDGDVSFEGSDELIELGRESRIKQKGGRIVLVLE